MTKKSMILRDRWSPPLLADQLQAVTLSQQVQEGGQPLLKAEPTAVYLRSVAPQIRLDADQVAGCYPSPGSTTSAQNFLPHVALCRRTLPWERRVRADWADVPWLALLVFTEADRAPLLGSRWDLARGVTLPTELPGCAAGETGDLLSVAGILLKEVLPAQADLALLTFACELPAGDSLGNVDMDSHISVVLGGRLPNAAAGVHTAVLVSLEGRADLFSPLDDTGTYKLVALQSWRFTPSDAADFELVIKALRYVPNGGTLAFGHAPGPEGGVTQCFDDGHTLVLAADRAGETYRYHGPLEAAPSQRQVNTFALATAPEETVPGTEVSRSCAFELGRLIAFSEPGILEALRALNHTQHGHTVPPPPPAYDGRPEALQRRDWVIREEQWALRQQRWVNAGGATLVQRDAWAGLQADPAGLLRVQQELGASLQAMQQEVAAAAQSAPVARVDKLQLTSKVDLATVTADALTSRVEAVNLHKNTLVQ